MLSISWWNVVDNAKGKAYVSRKGILGLDGQAKPRLQVCLVIHARLVTGQRIRLGVRSCCYWFAYHRLLLGVLWAPLCRVLSSYSPGANQVILPLQKATRRNRILILSLAPTE